MSFSQNRLLLLKSKRTVSTPVPVSVFSDAWGWWRADTFSGVTPNVVLTDKSTNGRNMTQAAGTMTAGTAANGQAKFTGNATARLTSAGTIKSFPCTIVTFGKRTAGAAGGHFGHTGASPTNTLWTGYESVDRHFIYNLSGTNNTTTDAGADACWIARIGWGSRVPIVNGLIQAAQGVPTIVRSSAIATELGTQYRGLNLDWYETIVWDRVLSIAEIDQVHAYGNTRYGLSLPLWSSYTAVPVLRQRGQSNSAGRGDRGAADVNIPAEYKGALTGINIWYGTVVNSVGDAFETMNLTNNHHMLGDTQAATYIGHEFTLAKEYQDRVGGTIYLQKFAVGSTNLAYDAALAYWDPDDETQAMNNTNRMFALDMQNWWKAMRVHQIAGRKPNIVGDVWFQGEQDAVNSTYANAYGANLVSFYTLSDAEQGISANKKFVCRIRTGGGGAFETTVQAQEATAVASIPNATLINTDTFGVRGGDPVHISFQGQLDIGTLIAGLI